MSTLIVEVVNIKDVTHLLLMVVCVWLLQCLTMYGSNRFLAMFYVSLNVLLRALSFGTTLASKPSSLSVLIRVLSND